MQLLFTNTKRTIQKFLLKIKKSSIFVKHTFKVRMRLICIHAAD